MLIIRLSTLLTIAAALLACEDPPPPFEPWGPCAKLENVAACPVGYWCLQGALGDMCVPECSRTEEGETTGPGSPDAAESCRESAPLTTIPLGQEFTCVATDGLLLCAALCDGLHPCGDGQWCEAGICLWPKSSGSEAEVMDL